MRIRISSGASFAIPQTIKVPVIIKNAGINHLVFRISARCAVGLFSPALHRERPLGILVEVLHVGMRGRAVEVKIILFYVFAVIALAVGEAKKTLFDNVLPFHSARAKQDRWSSEMPASPSSPHRYARDRA